MTAHTERDPLPREPWQPTSTEWHRRDALEATRRAVAAAREKRTAATARQDTAGGEA